MHTKKMSPLAPESSKQITVKEAYSHAVKYFEQGRYTDAEQVCKAILQVFPKHIDALNILGVTAQQLDRHDLAIEYFKQAICTAKPTEVLSYNLAISYFQLQYYHKAEATFRSLLEMAPHSVIYLLELSVTLEKIGALDEAIANLHRAVAINPDNPELYFALGNILQKKGDFDQALNNYQKAVSIRPDYLQALVNLGNAHSENGDRKQSIKYLHKALQLQPQNPDILCNLGAVFTEQGKLDDAVTYFRKAIAIKPDNPEALNNLGDALTKLGKVHEAEICLKKAISYNKNFAEAYSNLFLNAHYIPEQSVENLYLLHQSYVESYSHRQKTLQFDYENIPNPDRPLRIGLISPDLGLHPIGYFIAGLLKHRPQKILEITCYSDCRPDRLTERLQSHSDHWVDCRSLDHAELAQRINTDKIDILFDLAGHTAKNRLPVFVNKPAPIQITWAGYVGTTGLATMDWLLADSHYVSKAEEKFYTERIIRLPDSWVCYTPPDYALPTADRSYQTDNRQVVLANFGNPSKINTKMLNVWGQILQKLPQANLQLIYGGMDTPSNVQYIREHFAQFGVASERVLIEGKIPHIELMNRYNSVDLALDTLPYSGGLTTLEALWMGVPVVTTRGATFAGRHSTSILRSTGLQELVTDDLDAYIQLVANLVANPQKLAQIRDKVNSQFRKSPLVDCKKFATDFAVELQKIWAEWCVNN